MRLIIARGMLDNRQKTVIKVIMDEGELPEGVEVYQPAWMSRTMTDCIAHMQTSEVFRAREARFLSLATLQTK
jgi:hypothetical protein